MHFYLFIKYIIINLQFLLTVLITHATSLTMSLNQPCGSLLCWKMCNAVTQVLHRMGGDFDFNVADFEKISRHDIDECQRQFKTAGVEGCRRFLRGKQEEWKSVPLNVAVIGNSGVGKSSFINAIRCVRACGLILARLGPG